MYIIGLDDCLHSLKPQPLDRRRGGEKCDRSVHAAAEHTRYLKKKSFSKTYPRMHNITVPLHATIHASCRQLCDQHTPSPPPKTEKETIPTSPSNSPTQRVQKKNHIFTMDSSFRHDYTTATNAPTDAQAATLAQLPGVTGNTASHTPPLREALDMLFRICRPQWVSDFLFTPHISPLSVLTAPVNLSAAVSCTADHTNIDCTPPRNPRSSSPLPPPLPKTRAQTPLDNRTLGTFVFVPAFSVGATSVGFGVQHSVSLPSSANNAGQAANAASSHQFHYQHFRYTRDDAGSTMLVVHHDERTDTIRFHMFDNHTSTKRYRIALVLRRSDFLTRLRSQVIPDAVHCAISTTVHCIATLETRPCVRCNTAAIPTPPRTESRNDATASPTSPESSGPHHCHCPIRTQVPKHSLDFSGTMLSMAAHTGPYFGIANAYACHGGRQVPVATIASRFSVLGGADRSVIHRFQRWALSDHLQNIKNDPLHSVMPFANPDIAYSHNPDEAFVNYPTALTATDTTSKEHRSPPPELPDAQHDHSNQDHPQDTGAPPYDRASVSPAPPHDSASVSPAPQRGTTGKDQQQLERTEMRKQRNREAAQRSNMRRKIRNDTLKREISESNVRAVQLRAKELALREENLRLRHILKRSCESAK